MLLTSVFSLPLNVSAQSISAEKTAVQIRHYEVVVQQRSSDKRCNMNSYTTEMNE